MKNRIQKFKIKIIVALFVLVALQAVISYGIVYESSSKAINGLLNQSFLNAESKINLLNNIFFENDISEKEFANKNGSSTAHNKNSNPIVVIQFDRIPSNVTISKAPLKYDKDFAYSLTLDDGKDNAYTAAYPLLAGGYSSETGETYNGLYYTDGCGNNIPFKAGIAMSSVNSNEIDTHSGTPGSMTWDQLKILYSNDWDVFNHSYSHRSGPGTDYKFEISKNTSYIKSKTDIDVTHFVIPSGDGNYTQYAFNEGIKAVYNQSMDFPGVEGFKIDPPSTLSNFKLYRQFLNDDDFVTQSGKVDAVAARSNSLDHYWYSEFTHHVSVRKQGGSLLFPTFKSHMENIEKKYGAKGLDNIWMAPLQEVYEYLSVRDFSVITGSMDDNKSTQNIDFSSVPTDLRKYSLTLIVDSDRNISDVECVTASKISFKGRGNKKLINIEWDRHPIEIAAGINDPASRQGVLNVFPNPIENELTLSFPETYPKVVAISIVDQKGLEYNLGDHKVENGIVTINLKSLNLKKGNYIIKAFSNKEKLQFSSHIVKN